MSDKNDKPKNGNNKLKSNKNFSICKQYKQFLFPDKYLNNELEFLLSPILLKGKITTIFAPPGKGKSSFTYSLVSYMLKKGYIKKAICVFPDADASNREFRRLKEEYYKSDDLERSKFIPLFPNPSFIKLVISVANKKSPLGADLLIIDSLEQFFELTGLDFFKKVGSFYGVLRAIAMQGITILVLHHTNKQGVMAGRLTIVNQSDIVYYLRRVGMHKYFGDAYKHRGAELLNGKVEFYAEQTKDGDISITNDVVNDRFGYVVHLIKKALADGNTLRQYEIVNKVQQLAKSENNEVGFNKVRNTLSKYDGIYWEVLRGEKNSLNYRLINKPKPSVVVVDKPKEPKDGPTVNEDAEDAVAVLNDLYGNKGSKPIKANNKQLRAEVLELMDKVSDNSLSNLIKGFNLDKYDIKDRSGLINKLKELPTNKVEDIKQTLAYEATTLPL